MPGPIHLVNPLWDAYGGSEQRTLSLYGLLKDHADVQLWSAHRPDARLGARYPIHAIRPQRGQFPRGGTLVFIGIYAGVGRWVEKSKANRTIVVINTLQPELAEMSIARIAKAGLPPEIVYTSEAMQAAHSRPGIVEASPIDLTVFSPAPRPRGRPFTVGRLSRDDATKHHAGDLKCYRRLIERGCAVKIMGGRVLAEQMGDSAPAALALLPVAAESAPDFLRSLDCFFYRTAAGWFEPYGRVVFEAMACGLPVVAARNGGYAASIEHGVNGFLTGDDADAVECVLRLRQDEGLRARMGAAARSTAERIYGPDQMEAIRRFYLQPGG